MQCTKVGTDLRRVFHAVIDSEKPFPESRGWPLHTMHESVPFGSILLLAMTKKTVAVKASGGGGYTFADKVAAGLLAQMLKRKFPLEPDLGPITELHFETRDAGNFLDDLQLLLKRGPSETRCFVSIKSNRQITKSGFSTDFVQDAWEQWHGGDGSAFDPAKDILALIVGVVNEPTLQEWRELQKQAATTSPDRLAARLENAGQSSATQRAIFAGLRKLGDADADETETARLVSRLRVLCFSEDQEGDYINLCADIVSSGTIEEGAKLWSRLVQLASENRATGGFFDLSKLIRVLRSDFELKDYPDFVSDWIKIESLAAENVSGVRRVIGTTGIQLTRQEERARLKSEVDAHNVVVIAGESGSGKSALLSQILIDQPFTHVVWLAAGQLSKTSHAEIATAFGLAHNIPNIIAHTADHGCVLVVDGFEKFEGEARRRQIELLRAVQEEQFVGWKVILTCQPQSVEGAVDALAEVGITDVYRVDFDKPKLQEVFEAVGSLPGIGTLLLRAELQPMLRNLMVLDWVLRAGVAQRFSDSRPWIGATEIIEAIWDRWVGSGTMSLARDSLLRTLGQREGEKLSGAVHVDTIPPGELPLLGEFKQEGLVRVDLPSVQFSHDLMGDWARYRILKFAENNAAARITTLAHIPRWGRAIRLFAQSLVEHGSGLANWQAMNVQFSGADSDSKLAADLLLDGLLFAANSELLIEQVWAGLVANNGQILNRLLKRLRHIASVPDWRLGFFQDAKLAEQSKAWFRIPQPIYWIPVLRVLSRHTADVAEHALIQGAEVCALWLRTMPADMPGRREAASVAIELAKEAQGLAAEDLHFGDRDKIIYEALLLAAPEFPDEVTKIALELCGRRDEPAHALQRRNEKQQREAELRNEWGEKKSATKRVKHRPVIGLESFREGPLRPPEADGPVRRVADGFQQAVLESAALNGLIVSRPKAAREVLLAVCIEEPKPSDPYENRAFPFDRFGLADWPKGYPATYWKGPFLQFLQQAPEDGLDAIIRLVNYATARWIESGLGRKPTDDERKQHAFEFEFGGKSACWVGDCNVFGWHRYMDMHSDAVECALMALEKWLYDEVEKGRSISKWVQYIFDNAQSAAFAGVLVSVGLRYSGLFMRDLQPLLGNFYIYECQTSWAIHESDGTWSISLTGQPEFVVKLASEWNKMPHRRYLLRDLVPTLMLQHEGTMKYISAQKHEWAKLRQSSEKSRLDMEFFLARFDPANYAETPQDDGRVLITMRWPPHLERIAQQSQGDMNLRMLAMTLALRARRLLEEQETLSESSLPEFTAQLQQLATWKDPRDNGSQEHYRIDSVAGGASVLVIKHRTWLSKNPDLKKWCLTTLRELKPIEPEHFSPAAISNHSAEAFLGEAGVALLLESNDEWVLRMAFGGVTGAHYSSTLFTLFRAYLLRQQLGDRFGELVNVMVLWSVLRRAAISGSAYYAGVTQLPKYRSALFRRFARGRLKGPIPLERAEVMGRRLVQRAERRSMSDMEKRLRNARREHKDEPKDRKLHRKMPDLDLEVIQNGFGFVWAMIDQHLPGEEQKLRHYIEELFGLLMRTLPRPQTGSHWSEIEGTPYSCDRWILDCVAKFVAHANSIETARTFYRPILELGPAGRYWVEEFLRSWTTTGIQSSPDVKGFVSIWQDMIAYTEELSDWQPAKDNYWSRAEGLANHLMGLSETGIKVLGDAKYTSLVSSMAATFKNWGDRWLKHGSSAAWFAYFLRTASGRALLAQGVKQLSAVVDSLREDDWHRHDLGALLAEVLLLFWNHEKKQVEKNATLREAFLYFLAALCTRQIPEALHLREKVSEVIAIAN
jgi:hypothetical protein